MNVAFSTSMADGWRHVSEVHILDPALVLALRQHRKREAAKVRARQALYASRCAGENIALRLQVGPIVTPGQKSSVPPPAIVRDAESRRRATVESDPNKRFIADTLALRKRGLRGGLVSDAQQRNIRCAATAAGADSGLVMALSIAAPSTVVSQDAENQLLARFGHSGGAPGRKKKSALVADAERRAGRREA